MSKAPIRVLMVCLGNICRSPLAQGIFEHLADSENYVVDSAGTAAYHVGNPPDYRSVAVAAKYQIDLSSQRARQFVPEDFERYDHIYVMDRSNQVNVLRMATAEKDRAKVSLLIPENEVPDPYYGGEEGFEYCYQLIYNACRKRLQTLECKS